jgi:hypothetical protein
MGTAGGIHQTGYGGYGDTSQYRQQEEQQRRADAQKKMARAEQDYRDALSRLEQAQSERVSPEWAVVIQPIEVPAVATQPATTQQAAAQPSVP